MDKKKITLRMILTGLLYKKWAKSMAILSIKKDKMAHNCKYKVFFS